MSRSTNTFLPSTTRPGVTFGPKRLENEKNEEAYQPVHPNWASQVKKNCSNAEIVEKICLYTPRIGHPKFLFVRL